MSMTSSTFPTVPRTERHTRKRCDFAANWSSQKTKAEMAEAHAQRGQQYADEIVETAMGQWSIGDNKARPPSAKTRAAAHEEASRVADELSDLWEAKWGHLFKAAREKAVRDAEPLDYSQANIMTRDMLPSTVSYSTVTELTAAEEANLNEATMRNRGRQAAPVGWEADEGQSRRAVMGILGGK